MDTKDRSDSGILVSPKTIPVGAGHGLRAVDFFCGAGGMTAGLLSAGVDVLAGIDSDEKCLKVYEHNNRRTNGESPVFLPTIIEGLKPEHLMSCLGLERDDPRLVFAAGSPFRHWGRYRSDSQRNLRIEKLGELVAFFRPRYLILENSARFVAESEQEALARFKELLVEVGYSYDEQTMPLWSLGVPQTGEKYLLIGTRCRHIDLKLPKMESSEDGAFPVSMVVWNFIGERNGFSRLRAGEQCSINSQHRASGLSDLNLRRIQATPKNGGSRLTWQSDPTLRVDCYDRETKCLDNYGRMAWYRPGPTITTSFNRYSLGRFGHPTEDRAISVQEGAALQTFPPDYRFSSSIQEAVRQIGSSVPPALARILGQQVVEHCSRSILGMMGMSTVEIPADELLSVAEISTEERVRGFLDDLLLDDEGLFSDELPPGLNAARGAAEQTFSPGSFKTGEKVSPPEVESSISSESSSGSPKPRDSSDGSVPFDLWTLTQREELSSVSSLLDRVPPQKILSLSLGVFFGALAHWSWISFRGMNRGFDNRY